MASLLGHTTYRLLRVDVSFFRPLSSCYIEETEKWLGASPRQCATQEKVAMIFGYAYGKAATVAIAYCLEGVQIFN